MDVLALILAGGRGTRLDILSEKRSKPAVPFAGKFRIIDFALSNCCNSQIYKLGILTQYLPLSLNEHIGVGKPWDLDRRDSYVTLLQPHNYWYEGTADAVKKNIEFIRRSKSKYTIILSGDHIYKMDYRKVISQHIEKNADVTLAVKIVDMSEASRFGIVETNENNRIIAFQEKPKEPKSNKASMGIYVFDTEVLIESLLNINRPELDFGEHILPQLIQEKNVFAYDFYDYWMDVGTYESYLETNIDLATKNSATTIDLYDPNWKIYTKSEDLPPVLLGPDANVRTSLVSNGSKICGTVIDSVLSPGVIVSPGCVIKNSVILNGVVIGNNCLIENTIIDKNVVIGNNCIIGYSDDYTPNKESPKVLHSGINVIGKKAEIPANTTIMRNCRIFSTARKSSFPEKVIPSGSTIR